MRVVWSKRYNDYIVHFDKSKAGGGWFIDILRIWKNEIVKDALADIERYRRNGWERQATKIDRYGPPNFGREDPLRQELWDRGFDPDTLVISVRRRKDAPPTT